MSGPAVALVRRLSTPARVPTAQWEVATPNPDVPVLPDVQPHAVADVPRLGDDAPGLDFRVHDPALSSRERVRRVTVLSRFRYASACPVFASLLLVHVVAPHP